MQEEMFLQWHMIAKDPPDAKLRFIKEQNAHLLDLTNANTKFTVCPQRWMKLVEAPSDNHFTSWNHQLAFYFMGTCVYFGIYLLHNYANGILYVCATLLNSVRFISWYLLSGGKSLAQAFSLLFLQLLFHIAEINQRAFLDPCDN